MRLGAAVLGSLLLAGPVEAGHETGALALTIPPRQLQQLLETGASEPVTLVDLRGEPAYRRGHLPGARSVPAATLAREIAGLPRTGLLVVYGETTLDAVDAYRRLREAGFRNVRALAGGFGQWSREGLPVAPR